MHKNALSAEELSLALQSITEYAIFTLDEQGRVTMWNDGAARVFGFAPAEILGRSGAILFTPEDRAREAHLQEMRDAAQTGRAADERYHIRADSSRFYCSGVLFPVRDGSAEVRGYVKVCRDLSDRQEWEQRLIGAQEALETRVAERTEQLARELEERRSSEQRARAVLSRLISVQEEERRRIARDLHDHLGQQITALHLQLDALRRQLEAEGSPSLDRLRAVQDLFTRLDKDLGFFTWELRPAALYDVGLVAALTDFARAFSQNYGLPVTFQCVGVVEGELPPEAEVNLYRIAQEALNNAVKHAKASKADVLMQKVGGRVVLTISDDGTGFTPEDVENRTALDRGLGLSGMRERAGLLGGTFEVDSKPNQGTAVIVSVPASSQIPSPDLHAAGFPGRRAAAEGTSKTELP